MSSQFKLSSAKTAANILSRSVTAFSVFLVSAVVLDNFLDELASPAQPQLFSLKLRLTFNCYTQALLHSIVVYKQPNRYFCITFSSSDSTVVSKVLLYLTLSPPIPLRLYALPYWSNPPFLIFDIRALWRSGLALNPSNHSNLEQLALKGLNSNDHSQSAVMLCDWKYNCRPGGKQ